jgi:hypothetical protein
MSLQCVCVELLQQLAVAHIIIYNNVICLIDKKNVQCVELVVFVVDNEPLSLA